MTKKSTAMQQLAAIAPKKRGKGKKGRKIGRYSKHPSSQRYKAEHRWEANQIRRVKRHIKACPADIQARSWLVEHKPGAETQAFLAAHPTKMS